jgi:two-component system sensor histidine kinase BaeS
VVLAAIVAIILARAFLLPVKRLAEATHRLAAGAYDTRVAVRSGDEIGRLGEDFNRLAHALERNEQLRRRFIADVSHELRTPLAIARGEIEAIEDGVRPLSRESLASLKHEVGALGKLVEDLYQLALADVGALAYRKDRRRGRGGAQAVDAFGERLKEHRLEIDADLRRRSIRRRRPPCQAFRNLLENSLRYTDAGGTAHRRAARRRRVAVEFEDSAPAWRRGDATSSSASSARGLAQPRARRRGSGLAIVRSIVEARRRDRRAPRARRAAVTIALPELSLSVEKVLLSRMTRRSAR